MLCDVPTSVICTEQNVPCCLWCLVRTKTSNIWEKDSLVVTTVCIMLHLVRKLWPMDWPFTCAVNITKLPESVCVVWHSCIFCYSPMTVTVSSFLPDPRLFFTSQMKVVFTVSSTFLTRSWSWSTCTVAGIWPDTLRNMGTKWYIFSLCTLNYTEYKTHWTSVVPNKGLWKIYFTQI